MLERGKQSRVELYSEYCASVPMPLSDSSRQTRVVMELLLDRGHFEDICNLSFGPMFNPDAAAASLSPKAFSWVDVANNSAADSKYRRSLRDLLKPDGGLHRIMMAVSEPPADFYQQISSGWKSGDGSTRLPRASSFLQRDAKASSIDRDANSTQKMYRRTFPIPLRSITPQVLDILRSVDSDMNDFAPDRMPATLFIPFWEPPMKAGIVPSSGENLSNNQVTTNLHCTMLGYFLIRMSMYGTYRSMVHGTQIMNGSLSNGRVGRHFNFMAKPKVKAVTEHLMRYLTESFNERPSTGSWQFYEDLMVEYMMYYTKEDIVKSLSGQRYSAYMSWTSEMAYAALLAHYPAQQQCRFFSGGSKEDRRLNSGAIAGAVGVDEESRKPLFNPAHCASVAKSIFYLTEALSAHYDLLSKLPGPCQVHLTATELDPRASSEITLPLRAVYRSSLIAMRQLVVSIPHFPHTPNQIHFDCFRLFRTLCTIPLDFSEMDRKYYFMSHYEIYSFLLRDVLRYVFKTNFCASADRLTLRCLRRCLEELAHESLRTLLEEAHGVVERQNTMEISRITSLFVLDWSTSRGNGNIRQQAPALISPFGPEVVSAAARARMAVLNERRQMISSMGPEGAEGPVPESDEVPPVRTLMQKLKGGEPDVYRLHELSRLEEKLSLLFPSSTDEIANIREGRGGSASPRRGFQTPRDPYSPVSRAPPLSFGEATSFNESQSSHPGAEPAPVAIPRAKFDLGSERELSLISQGWRGNLKERMKAPPRVMTARERLVHLQGRGGSLHPSQCKGLRFNKGSIDANSYYVNKHDEIGFLLPLTRAIDVCIQTVGHWIMGRSAPTCPRGHKLVLVSDARQACTRHLADRAVWECPSCHTAACDSCVPTPIVNVDGTTFRRYLPYTEKCSEDDAPVSEVCAKCYLVLGGEFALAYEDAKTKQVVCPNCALRPWKLVSVRFLASTTFYVWALVSYLLYLFFTNIVLAPAVQYEEGTASFHAL